MRNPFPRHTPSDGPSWNNIRRAPGPLLMVTCLLIVSLAGAGYLPRSCPLARQLLASPIQLLASLLPRRGPAHLTVLLMGSDATGGEARASIRGNTDTILLAHFNLRTHRVKLISIPRDTRVPIPGYPTFKVNAANPYGGAQLAVKTVSQFLNVPIDRYLLVNLDGIIHAVDAVGGVDVTIPKPLDYDDWTGHLHIHFTQGRHHLDGREVEAYIRFRHDGNGDIGRIQRQQQFIRQVATQVFTPSNLLKAPAIWEILASHAQTNLTPAEALAMVRCLDEPHAAKKLQLAMLPGNAQYVDGYSYWIVNRHAARTLVRKEFAANG